MLNKKIEKEYTAKGAKGLRKIQHNPLPMYLFRIWLLEILVDPKFLTYHLHHVGGLRVHLPPEVVVSPEDLRLVGRGDTTVLGVRIVRVQTHGALRNLRPLPATGLRVGNHGYINSKVCGDFSGWISQDKKGWDNSYNAERAVGYKSYNSKRAVGYKSYNSKRAVGYKSYNSKRAVGYTSYNSKRAVGYKSYNSKRAVGYKSYNSKRAVGLQKL